MHALRAFEDTHILPLVQSINADPVRDQVPVTMTPGSMVFMMNDATDPEVVSSGLMWRPLTVIYQDRNNTTDWVFRYTGRLPVTAQEPLLTSAEIRGVVKLMQGDGEILWVDPVGDTVFMSFPMDEASKILSNSWYVFRGAVLPMLYEESFYFPRPREARVFQVNVIHKIVAVYKDFIAAP